MSTITPRSEFEGSSDDDIGDLKTTLARMTMEELEGMRGDDQETDRLIEEVLDDRWRKHRSIYLTISINNYFEKGRTRSITLRGPRDGKPDPREPSLSECWQIIKELMAREPSEYGATIHEDGSKTVTDIGTTEYSPT